MTDRNEWHDDVESVRAGFTTMVDTVTEDDLANDSQQPRSLAGEVPLLRVVSKPTLVSVPPPHNAAALAGSEFANANLPVVNIHAKTRKLEVPHELL